MHYPIAAMGIPKTTIHLAYKNILRARGLQPISRKDESITTTSRARHQQDQDLHPLYAVSTGENVPLVLVIKIVSPR